MSNLKKNDPEYIAELFRLDENKIEPGSVKECLRVQMRRDGTLGAKGEPCSCWYYRCLHNEKELETCSLAGNYCHYTNKKHFQMRRIKNCD